MRPPVSLKKQNAKYTNGSTTTKIVHLSSLALIEIQDAVDYVLNYHYSMKLGEGHCHHEATKG